MERLPLLISTHGRAKVLGFAMRLGDVEDDSDRLSERNEAVTTSTLRHAGVVGRKLRGNVPATDQWWWS